MASQAILAVEEMAVIRGDDEEEPCPCSEYVPGRVTPVRADDGSWKDARLCKHCEYSEEDHEAPEPAHSQRQTIIPEARDEEDTPLRHSDADVAAATVDLLMGGPSETYLDRLCEQVATTLGRAPNRWERSALEAYVARVTIGVLSRTSR